MPTLARLVRTTAFKLTLVYLSVFVALSLGLIGYISSTTSRLFDRQLEIALNREIAELSTEYRQANLFKVMRTISQRSMQPDASVYLITDAAGNPIAGNVSELIYDMAMAAEDAPFPVRYMQLSLGEAHRAMAKQTTLGGGYRLLVARDVEDRIEALLAIEAAHRTHGHVQEVIIQNFQRKPDIAMADHPEPALDAMLRTIAAARIILSPEISLQAPPNLGARHIDYLSAGINDWGGISPVTIDFINPGHAWPEINALARNSAAAGYALQERLTVYPRFLREEGFIDPGLRPAVDRLAGPDGLAAEQALESVA